MSKEIAPSHQVAIRILSVTMKYLIEAGGSLSPVRGDTFPKGVTSGEEYLSS